VPNGCRDAISPACSVASIDEASKKWRKPSNSIDDYGVCNYSNSKTAVNASIFNFESRAYPDKGRSNLRASRGIPHSFRDVLY